VSPFDGAHYDRTPERIGAEAKRCLSLDGAEGGAKRRVVGAAATETTEAVLPVDRRETQTPARPECHKEKRRVNAGRYMVTVDYNAACT
jgi:hypothetical protein